MFDSCLRWCLPALCAVAALSVAAQPSSPARPDPLDPAAAVPPTHYRSPLPSGRPTAELPLVTWREANDNVARIGGWRAYAREVAAQPPSSAASVPRAPGAPGDLGGHAGHRAP
jgi:hypothetical protein